MTGPEACAERSPGGTWRATTLACASAILLLVLLDAVEIALRHPGGGVAAGFVVFIVLGWALGTALALPLVLARAWIAGRLRHRGEFGHVLTGTPDGVALFLIAIVGQDPRWPAGDARAFALLGGACATGAIGWFGWRLRARPWVGRAFAFLAFAAGLVALRGIRWNGDDWVRLAVHAVVVASATWLVAGALARHATKRAAIGACTLAALLTFAASPVLRAMPDARRLLYGRSSHVRAWAYCLESLFDRGGDRTPGHRATTATAASPTTAHAAARGQDVLILSLDALRWDALDAIGELRRALGPHAVFTRAVSPAPATREALAAIARGRPARQLQVEPIPGVRGPVLWRDRAPTLGHRLARAGYRAVVVPLTDILDPRSGVASGFETILVSNFDARLAPPLLPPHAQSHVLAESGLPVLLEIARATPGHLCVWTHLIETHAPYRWGHDASGPASLGGLRHAASDLASRLAAFVREFERVRGRPPLVVVFGDHGEEFGEHGGHDHASSVYAEQARVVFLLRAPGVPEGAFDAPVSTASVAPTVLDLLGLDGPATMTEPSLLPALTANAPWPEVAVTELHAPGRRFWVGYTTARYRLVRDPVHDVDMLYDSREDPLEQRDLAAERPDLLAEMKRIAHAWDEAH